MKRLIFLAVMAVFPLVSVSTSEADRPAPHPLTRCTSFVDADGAETGPECWYFVVTPGVAQD